MHHQIDAQRQRLLMTRSGAARSSSDANLAVTPNRARNWLITCSVPP
jgi:hypothetical protein